MDFEVSEEQQRLCEETRSFCLEILQPLLQPDAPMAGRGAAWKACADHGLLGLCISEEWGGRGLDPLTTVLVLESFGRHCSDMGLVFSVCAQLLAASVPFEKWGEAPEHRILLKRMCAGEQIVASMMTEPQAGSDLQNLQTRAKRTVDGYVLGGEKAWATNAPVADLALIYAKTDEDKGLQGGVSAFLIPTETPGMTVHPAEELVGHRSAAVGGATLSECAVAREALVGNEGGGFWLFNEAMNWERVGLFAAHVGAMDRFVQQAVTYAKERQQGGVALGSFQAVSHRLADMKTRLEAGRLLVYRAASRLHLRSVGLDASMAKLFVSESLLSAAIDTARTFGATGYSAGSPIGSILGDSLGTLHYSGTSDIQRNIIVRWLGL